jgi:hypothetical protein
MKFKKRQRSLAWIDAEELAGSLLLMPVALSMLALFGSGGRFRVHGGVPPRCSG